MGVAGRAAARTEETPIVQEEVVTARRRPHAFRVAAVADRPTATTIVVAVAINRPVRGGAGVTEL